LHVWTVRIQSVMRYHGTRGSLAANSEMMDVEDRFDVLVDANDQLLERVVSAILDWLFYTEVCTLVAQWYRDGPHTYIHTYIHKNLCNAKIVKRI